MFYIMDEGSRISIQLPSKWKLIARDAFNGTILWKRDIAEWQNQLWPLKSGPTNLTRRLVSTDNEVYTTLSYDSPMVAIDAATGKTLRTYEGTDTTEEMPWGRVMQKLATRPGKLDPLVGINNPTTGKPTGFIFNKAEWDRIVGQINKDKEEAGKTPVAGSGKAKPAAGK